MCKCTPNIRTPFCGKGDCVNPASAKPIDARGPFSRYKIGISQPEGERFAFAPSCDEMRSRILAASRDSQLIHTCLQGADYRGLSGEDKYVTLAYHALVELERLASAAHDLAMCTIRPTIIKEAFQQCTAFAPSASGGAQCVRNIDHKEDHLFRMEGG